MKVCVIADIHGNYDALKKCIQEILDVQMYKANDKQISLSQEIKVLFNTELAETQDFHIVSDI